MSDTLTFDRRKFLKTTALGGGALVIGFYIPFGCKGKASSAEPAKLYKANAFVSIATDNKVSIVANHHEMGQGIYTTLCQLIGDEMEVPWDNIKVVHAAFDKEYNHPVFGIQLTGGSTTSYTEFERMRRIGASVKSMLVQAAANQWQVDPSLVTAKQGVVSYENKQLTYGELAEAASLIPLPDMKTVTLKDPKDFVYIGKPMHRLDTPTKINGQAVFGMDVTLPGMLVAVVQRPPAFGGTVKSFDATAAKAIPGVKHVVQIDRGVAVVADGFWNAKKGRDALKVEWDLGPNADLNTKNQGEKYSKLIKEKGHLAEGKGDINAAFGKAKKIVQATYELPYLAHAPMEPLNCTADVKENECDIYLGTQSQTLDANNVAAVTGIPVENIRVNLQYLGGGFGRRVTFDSHVPVEAAQISQKVGAPVKVIWTREDDMRGGYYRSRTLTTMKGSVDANNQMSGLQAKVISESFAIGTAWESMLVNENGADELGVEGIAHSPYNIENVDINWLNGNSGVPTLWFRSVGHSRNGFIMETFIDEMAEAAGKDPADFRRELLKNDPRGLDALNMAVSKSPWGKELSDGHALGLAVHHSFGSTVGYVAEVSLENNWPKVHRVWAGVDCGPYVNPDGIEAQIQGAVVFGLTMALYGELTLENGGVQQSNFHDYRMLRIHETPHVESHIVDSDKPMGGIGETGVPPIAAAVANALYKLTGKRIHKLPFKRSDFA